MGLMKSGSQMETRRVYKPVYGMMITGSSAQRIEWARACIERFVTKQTYIHSAPVRVLVLNEHFSESALTKTTRAFASEWKITNRKETTLGALRNQLLQKVPSDSYVYVLDDDDYIPSDSLEVLLQSWPNDGSALIQICNRLNHNILTNTSWRSYFASGFVHYLADINTLRSIDFHYTDANTLEDLTLHKLSRGERFLWTNNPAKLYVRYTHGKNCSPYVRREQQAANHLLGEESVVPEEHTYCIQHQPQSRIAPSLFQTLLHGGVLFVFVVLCSFYIVHQHRAHRLIDL